MPDPPADEAGGSFYFRGRFAVSPHLADMPLAWTNVRFRGESGQRPKTEREAVAVGSHAVRSRRKAHPLSAARMPAIRNILDIERSVFDASRVALLVHGPTRLVDSHAFML